MTISEVQELDAFADYFSVKNLKEIYSDKLKAKKVVGIDGLHPKLFQANLDKHAQLICKKVNKGNYSFTNYGEYLVSKGRGKAPRILSVPVVRDQLVLKTLNSYLQKTFPCASTDTAKTQIKILTSFLTSCSQKSSEYGILKVDVSGFYDNIDRDILMNKIRASVDEPIARKLIYDSLTNTTVPRGSAKSSTRSFYRDKGVPQGIAISNILANIYLLEFDEIFKEIDGIYFRYVDDVLVISKNRDLPTIKKSIKEEFQKLGLEFNEEKTEEGGLDSTPFDFLGYTFRIDLNEPNQKQVVKVGVREASINKLIKGIAVIFANAKNGRREFADAKKDKNKDEYRDYLIEKLNEKITGAISSADEENEKPRKTYGWLFYFDKINDLSLLHRFDRLVTKFCERSEILDSQRPKELKSFVKAYREIGRMRKENRKTSNYIRIYHSEKENTFQEEMNSDQLAEAEEMDKQLLALAEKIAADATAE
jgi:retron-type reverse transcriptase